MPRELGVRMRMKVFAITLALLLFGGSGAFAQPCNDGNQCTENDMCSGGECHGTPMVGAICDDGFEGSINDRCVVRGSRILCGGDPAPAGTACERGCGTLQHPFPENDVLLCIADESMFGKPCPDGVGVYGVCATSTCEHSNATTGGVLCRFELVECPDTDNDPCTTPGCNSETGCALHPTCAPDCETCDPSTGACTPANIGAPCDDFNPCTTESHCDAVDIPGLGTLGICQGPPTAVPTATATPIRPTPTPTAVTPTPTLGRCTGDCNRNGKVGVDEVITGVNIALARAPFSECPVFDESGNDLVEVSELVRGVSNLLGGCTSP